MNKKLDKKFVNRREELNWLKKEYESEKAKFVVLYGRRRIGKTRLIEELIRAKGGIRLLGREESEKKQLERFSLKLGKKFKDDFLLSNPFRDWDAFFTYLEGKTREKRFLVALDEFPYLVNASPSLPSILQDHWDSKLKNSKVFLILSGSSISMMETEILGRKSPLYGRRTGQILLTPLKFFQIPEFLPGKSVKEIIRFYSVFGGTPAYLEILDPKKGLEENIKEKVLPPQSFLNRDVHFILREELREPRNYFSILESIASGNTSIGEIMNDTGLGRGIVGKYLSVLEDLHIIRREVPVTSHKKSKRGIYRLKDNFFRFWFRFVYPNKEWIETGNLKYLLEDLIEPELHILISYGFEDICKQFLIEKNKRERMGFSKIGKWWYRDEEIDVVALNEKESKILFGECKWSKNPIGINVLRELEEKATDVRWKKRREKYYALFSKSGFTKELKELDRKDLLLFDLEKLSEIFQE